MFKEMRSDQENRGRQHQIQLESLRSQLSNKDIEDEKRRCEYDRILLTTKNRLEDEEVSLIKMYTIILNLAFFFKL